MSSWPRRRRTMKILIFYVVAIIISGSLGVYLSMRKQFYFHPLYWCLGVCSAAPLLVGYLFLAFP